MQSLNIYLSPEETRALQLLAKNKSYKFVKQECLLFQDKFHLFLQSLRRKTGIEDTSNAQDVQNYLTAHAQAVNGSGPSAMQMEALRRVVGVDFPPHPLEALASRMDLKGQKAADVYASALRAAGIFSRDPRTQRLHARMFLATRTQEGKLALSTDHKKVLNLLVQGYSKHGIAIELQMDIKFVKSLVSEIAQRLGVVCRGRGAQDRLIQFAAALMRAKEPSEPITMDDPAF